MRGIFRGIGEEAELIAHRPNDLLPDAGFVFHFREKIVIEVVNEPGIVVELVFKLPRRPTRMSKKTCEVDIGVLATEKARFFQVDAEIKLEGGGTVEPLPTSNDQFFLLDRAAFEHRDVSKIVILELFVKLTEPLARGTIENDPQRAILFAMRGEEDHGLEKIRISQARVGKQNVA